MYRDWEIGDKIVCIDASTCKCGCKTPFNLVENEIYKIKRLDGTSPDLLRVDVGMKPIPSGIHAGRTTVAAKRFRKLNKPDEASGNKEDFVRLLNANRSKQSAPNPRIPVPAGPMPMLPAPTRR
jgi:hypothetical protein